MKRCKSKQASYFQSCQRHQQLEVHNREAALPQKRCTLQDLMTILCNRCSVTRLCRVCRGKGGGVMHTPGSLGSLLVHLLNAPQPNQLVGGTCDGKSVRTTHQSAESLCQIMHEPGVSSGHC